MWDLYFSFFWVCFLFIRLSAHPSLKAQTLSLPHWARRWSGLLICCLNLLSIQTLHIGDPWPGLIIVQIFCQYKLYIYVGDPSICCHWGTFRQGRGLWHTGQRRFQSNVKCSKWCKRRSSFWAFSGMRVYPGQRHKRRLLQCHGFPCSQVLKIQNLFYLLDWKLLSFVGSQWSCLRCWKRWDWHRFNIMAQRQSKASLLFQSEQ